METRKYLVISGFVLSMFAFASCQDNNRQKKTEDVEMADPEITNRERMKPEDNTVSARIEDDEELSTFSTGMTRAELTDDFSQGEGPFTIFVPNNVAYERLSQEERDEFRDPASAGAGTNYLVVERNFPSDSLRQSINNVGGDLEMITMQGERLVATLEGDSIVLKDDRGNTATIIGTDREAFNGIVHVIDRVLRPVDVTRNEAANRNTTRTDGNMENENPDQGNMN